jgi:hypothetical protein
MTGSALAPIVIPIVVTISLAIWLIMVYHAAGHPQWGSRPARGHAGPKPAAPADPRQPDPGRVPQRRAA